MNYFKDALALGQQGVEIWAGTAMTLNQRYKLILSANPYSPDIQAENQRMVCEKASAGLEVSTEMHKAMLALGAGAVNPFRFWQQILMPVHKATVENASRLSKAD